MTTLYSARLRGARVSARKARLVVDLVRGKLVSEALDLLKVTNKKSSPLVAGLIRSAMANAQNKATVDVDRLVVVEAFVDGGMMLKRWLPRAQGRATPILKRSSHITVRLGEI